MTANLWAKTGPNDTYLPLEAHLADVGAVAARLWVEVLTSRQRGWFANGLGRTGEDVGAWIRFLAGVHDIGKATPTFQRMVPELATALLGPDSGQDGRPKRYRHDVLSGSLLVKFLADRGVESRTAHALAAAISGHHGELRSDGRLLEARAQNIEQSRAWHARQEDLLARLAEASGLRLSDLADMPDTATILAVAGLVSVADWIGSDSSRFPVEVRGPETSEALAAKAFEVEAWRLPQLARPGATFGEVFADADGGPREPRPSQQAVIDLWSDSAGEPRLVVIEDRTGSGKTEAALWVVFQEIQRGARGFYIGLPTRATAGQFHRRATDFARQLWGADVAAPRLLHSTADLEIDPRPSTDDVSNEAAAIARAEAGAWFAGHRRGLLAPAAVGTVDQLLLAILRSKHHFVGLWGLQGKVVVVDEAHAYDRYSGTLLERAVSWLAALDCTVVILSATLPQSTRRALERAFTSGLNATWGSQGGANAESPQVSALDALIGVIRVPAEQPSATAVGEVSAAYPRLLSVTRSRTEVQAVQDARAPRSFSLAFAQVPTQEDGHAVAELVSHSVRDGGCVAVVCNTVARAQERFHALREALPADVDVQLLHSRLRTEERAPVEDRLFRALGPPTKASRRPLQMVVVATQIVEQSLDIDFDAMFTDLAPIDLMIQRAGRLHRHARGAARPKAHGEPRLTILDSEGVAVDRPHLRSSDVIYAPAILHRTRALLRTRTSIEEPGDLDTLIEGVYGDAVPSGCAESEADAIRVMDALAAKEAVMLSGVALAVAVGDPGSTTRPWNQNLRELPDADGVSIGQYAAQTRWSERPSLSIVLLFPDELPASRRTNPSRDDVRKLMGRALSVTTRQLTAPLTARYRRDRAAGREPRLHQPAAWAKNAHLRHLTLVELDEHGRALPLDAGDDVIQLPLRYDRTEGAILERPDPAS